MILGEFKIHIKPPKPSQFCSKKGGQWSARVSIKQSSTARTKQKMISLFFYAGMDENSSGFKLSPIMVNNNVGEKMVGIIGESFFVQNLTTRWQ